MLLLLYNTYVYGPGRSGALIVHVDVVPALDVKLTKRGSSVRMIIYKDNDNLFEVKIKNAATGNYVNDATVAITIKDVFGNLVAGEVFPKEMTYIVGSNGKYQVTLSNFLSLVPGQNYTALITTSSGGLDATQELPLRAAVRIA